MFTRVTFCCGQLKVVCATDCMMVGSSLLKARPRVWPAAFLQATTGLPQDQQPSHQLIDQVYNLLESGAVTYIHPLKCHSREHETESGGLARTPECSAAKSETSHGQSFKICVCSPVKNAGESFANTVINLSSHCWQSCHERWFASANAKCRL